jgi:hypothetical protein
LSSVYDKLIARLTDNYDLSATGHVAKFMNLAALHIQENEDLLQQIGDWRSIDNAEGVTLDYIGRNFGQNRDGVDDVTFRTLIKARIIKNNSNGSIPSLIRYLSFILGVEKNAVKISENWRNGEPVGVLIEFELEDFLKLGVPIETFTNVLNDIMPAGVNADVLYNGSFMFSDYDDQVQDDEQHGFGDIVTDTQYFQGTFALGDIGDTKPGNETIFVDGSTIQAYADGWANEDLGIGGRFGVYYKINGFNDGTNQIYQAW